MNSKRLPPAFCALADDRNLATDAALAEVLPLLDGHLQREAWDLLVRRGHEPTLAAVVARFGSYNRTLQSQIVARAESLLGPVRFALEDSDTTSLAGAIAIIVHSGCGPLIYLLADAIRSPDERMRRLAGAGLCRISQRILDRPEAGGPAAYRAGTHDATVDHLGEALCRAVHLWDIHRQRKTIEWALSFPARTMPAIQKKLDEPRSSMTPVLIEFLTQATNPRLAEFTVRALAEPNLQSAAAHAIAETTSARFVRALLGHTWLLSDQGIAKGCRRLRRIKWIDDRPELLGDVGERDAGHAVSWIVMGGGSHRRRMDRLGELLRLNKPALASAVLRHLIGDRSSESTEMLGKLAGRFAGDCKELCRQELRRRGSSTSVAGMGDTTGDSQTTDVQTLFSTFWDRFDLDGADEMVSTREELLRHKAALPRLLRARLAFGDPPARRRVLLIIAHLGLTEELDETVYRSAHDPDPMVRGCALSLVGRLPGRAGVRILRQAVNDPDDRVQANAIEALDLMDWPERMAVTAPKLRSGNNRVRANAIKSLLRMEIAEAGDALLAMLEHSSGSHRLSAVWVVESVGLKSLSSRMRMLSRDDPDERVRRRAASTLERLGEPNELADVCAS
ncbi:MAG: HEAT repeat domain-containing protein [Planctomycetes bacterium]|nr:HEAT repeat domain-containing protein [Planctomycetota bacterium]